MGLNAETINDLINSKENQRSIEDARALIHSRPCVLFAGAGTSKMAGYPLWRELLDEMQTCLADRGLADPRKDPDNLLRSADELYDCFDKNGLLDPDYYSFLYQTFRPKPTQSLELQNILVSLPFRGIATTNWDKCFEIAIRRDWPERTQSLFECCFHPQHPNHVRDYFDSLWRDAPSISVGHLHGVYDFAKEIILTASQYDDAYGSGGKWTFLRRTIWALMTTQRLIFVGFGMDDPFITTLLKFVSGELWDRNGTVHYFITHVSADTKKDPIAYRRALRAEMGVQSIFYQVQGNDHSRLSDLLYDLGANPAANRRGQPRVSELLGPL
jgi:SIR2-like domain